MKHSEKERRNARGSMVALSAIVYVGFCLLVVLHPTARQLLGEPADVLQMSAYLWPYPIFLSLLKPFEGYSVIWLVVDLVGLAIVVVASSWLAPRLLRIRVPQWLRYTVMAVAWYLPLLGLQIVVWGTALVMGMSVGE